MVVKSWGHRLKRFALCLFLGLSTISFVIIIYLDAHYAKYAPRTPVHETGQVYATYMNHGAVVYLTKEQVFLVSNLIPVVALVFFILAFVMSIWLSKVKSA